MRVCQCRREHRTLRSSCRPGHSAALHDRLRPSLRGWQRAYRPRPVLLGDGAQRLLADGIPVHLPVPPASPGNTYRPTCTPKRTTATPPTSSCISWPPFVGPLKPCTSTWPARPTNSATPNACWPTHPPCAGASTIGRSPCSTMHCAIRVRNTGRPISSATAWSISSRTDLMDLESLGFLEKFKQGKPSSLRPGRSAHAHRAGRERVKALANCPSGCPERGISLQ